MGDIGFITSLVFLLVMLAILAIIIGLPVLLFLKIRQAWPSRADRLPDDAAGQGRR